MNSRWYRVIDCLLFIIMLVAAIGAISVLFYRQAIAPIGGMWPSDTYSYIEEICGTNTTYSYPYPIMFAIGKVINCFVGSPMIAIVVTSAIFNGLAIIITKIVFNKQTGARILATIVTVSLFFLSMIYGPVFKALGVNNIYAGVFSPNPWQNQTYMAARPFMILAFLFGAKTLEAYEKELAKGVAVTKEKISKYIVFAIVMLLATMTKPSYTIVHMAAAGIIMIVRFLINKGRIFRQTFILGLCYIPTIISLLYQYFAEFTGVSMVGDEQGIGIELFRVWRGYTDNIPLALILAGLFPLTTLVVYRKDIKIDTQFRFSWQVYLAGLIMAAVFYEKGFREAHGNFMWGYECGLFLVFLTGIIKLLRNTMTCIYDKSLKKQFLVLSVQWFILAIHTIMGLYYFYMLTVFGIDYN